MTNSNDTATPAMSAETVPSEEFVLVPKGFLDFLRHAPVGSGTCCCGDEMDRHSDPMSCGHSPVDMWDHSLSQWLKQIANLSASHLAKEGGEAGAGEAAAKLAHRIVLHCQNTPPEEAIEIAERLIVTALNHPMNVPQPSPALAKGGDAVRVPPIEQTTTNDQIAAVMLQTGSPAQVRQALAYAAGNLGASTPTEGPASQTEGMGGDVNEAAEREAFEKWWPKHWPNAGSVSDNVWQGWMGRAALTPPETAEAVPPTAERAWERLVESKSEATEAARLREDLERIITDTESKDAADLEDMANVGHAIMAALKRLGRSYSNSPEEVLFDLENELFDAKREMDAVIATMDRTGVPREKNDVWFGLCRRIEMLSAERDDAVKALETAREDIAYFEAEARRFASHYTPNSDGWNTFIIFADKIADRAARSASSQGGE